MSQTTTQNLREQSQHLRSEFDQMVSEVGEGLWNYCRYLTGSPWDGEDLYQETMLKALGGLFQRWHPTNLKSYLYRVATNSWIDQCRKQKKELGILQESDEPMEDFTDGLDLEEALQYLSQLFTPRQTAMFLLMEAFQFKAEEVASIVKTTPGAVYAATRRMKQKLKDSSIEGKTNAEISTQSNDVIQAYLKAFNQGDLEGMLAMISDQAHYEASLGFLEVTKDEMRSGSLMYGLPGHTAKEFMLWGKPVIVVLADSEEGPLIHDIQQQEVENGKIVYQRSFFFRKEFILAAARELGLSPQLNKPPLNWEV